ncbi:MAG: class I SAM-dependent methyltransferase [Ginsengibacter sp.]
MNAGNLLAVGAAAGFILKGFENKGWNGMGIEPNKSMVDFAKKEVEVNVQQGTLETMETEEKFDLISIIQVMAHLYNLNTSLERINFFLKPNGYVLIETWDKDSVTAKLFGKNWHEYSPPGTLNYFSRKSLERLMNKYKFKLVKQGTPKKSINSTHAKSLIQHKLSESKSLRLLKPFISFIPGNIILPYPSEDLFWALYQKN